MSAIRIEVLRPFTHEGARYEPGSRLTVGAALAMEVIASNKAKRIAPASETPQQEEHKPVAGPRQRTQR